MPKHIVRKCRGDEAPIPTLMKGIPTYQEIIHHEFSVLITHSNPE